MKYTKLIIVLFAVALAGCSSLASTPDPVAVAAPAPVEVITPVIVEETESTGVIAIGTLLDKLNESGCTIDKIVYREVKRGGHVEVICKHTNDLALDSEL